MMVPSTQSGGRLREFLGTSGLLRLARDTHSQSASVRLQLGDGTPLAYAPRRP